MKKEGKSVKREKKPAESKSEKKRPSEPSSPDRCDVFDLGRIERLVALMKTNELTEIDLAHGEHRIQLRRGHQAAAPMAAAPVPAIPVPATPTPMAATPAPIEDTSSIQEILSPMVGTFYLSSSPDAAPFVKAGDVIGPEKTVCIIEAMKVFNEIQAEMSGKVVAVLAKNGDGVEYGQPLFKIDTRG